jgi:predicted dehydrogenase
MTTSSHPPRQLTVGIVGCGLIAQIMHFHYLRELSDRFRVIVLCDLSERALQRAAAVFPDALCSNSWEDVLSEPVDCVLVLSSGSHEDVAIASLTRGKHVFVEKPLCYSAEEGKNIIAAAEKHNTRLMVGYMKQYDPAYELLKERLNASKLRFVRVTTLESPQEPYLAHFEPNSNKLEPRVRRRIATEESRRITQAIGSEDPLHHRAYGAVLLQSMVHEFNALRGLLGEPTELRAVDFWAEAAGVTATLKFGDTECVCAWIELPGIARYEQEFCFYGTDERATLSFPSPFLRNSPTRLAFEEGKPGTPASWRTEHTVSYEDAFKRELEEFHRSIVEEREPRTPGWDGLRDVVLCQSILSCYTHGAPVPMPTVAS